LSETAEWRPGEESLACYRLSKKDFESIVDTESPQGVAAVCQIPETATTESLSVGNGVLIAMDAIQDPGNLGTMVRSAVWFGASGILCGKGTVDLYHPKVVRSTAGVTGLLPVSTGILGTELEKLESAGWNVLLLDAGPEASPLQHLPLPDRIVLVVGNEGNGIDSSLFDRERQRVAIEGNRDRLESLNAAVALSIVLYELTKH
ncbi:MAG: RNA methyltransferase, partial [Balneolaceae bacterium]